MKRMKLLVHHETLIEPHGRLIATFAPGVTSEEKYSVADGAELTAQAEDDLEKARGNFSDELESLELARAEEEKARKKAERRARRFKHKVASLARLNQALMELAEERARRIAQLEGAGSVAFGRAAAVAFLDGLES